VCVTLCEELNDDDDDNSIEDICNYLQISSILD